MIHGRVRPTKAGLRAALLLSVPVLGLLLVGAGWSQAEDRKGDESRRIADRAGDMAEQVSGDAKAGGAELKPQDPPPASGVPIQGSPEDADYPWTAAMAEKAFDKARANAVDENKLLGRWGQVARANRDGGYYNPKKEGALLSFSAAENPFNDSQKAAILKVVGEGPLVYTTSFAVRSPSVFFKIQREYRGWTWVHVFEDEFECRLLDQDRLICKRITSGEGAWLTWEGFVRFKQ